MTSLISAPERTFCEIKNYVSMGPLIRSNIFQMQQGAYISRCTLGGGGESFLVCPFRGSLWLPCQVSSETVVVTSISAKVDGQD